MKDEITKKPYEYFIEIRTGFDIGNSAMLSLFPKREPVSIMGNLGKRAYAEINVWPCVDAKELVRLAKEFNGKGIQFRGWQRQGPSENATLIPAPKVLRMKVRPGLQLTQMPSKSVAKRIGITKRDVKKRRK